MRYFMKKAITLFAVILSCLLLLIFCSCGGNMKGWPTFDLNLNIESYNEVTLEYNRLPYGRSKSKAHFYGTSTDKEVINDIYCVINSLPYSEKNYRNINTEEYYDNIIIKFIKDYEVFVFKFYSYGIYDGYFVFDNGETHKYCGDFVSMTYEEFKDKLS